MTRSRRAALSGGVVVVLGGGVACAVGQTLTFAEASKDAGLVAQHRLAPGYPSILGEMSGGASVGDFNADGWPDLFVIGGGQAPDRLFINRGDGTFADEAPDWGVARRHRGTGSAVGDVNRDGYPDLFVVSFGDAAFISNPFSSLLYLNNGPDDLGRFSFREVASEAGVNRVATFTDGMGACFGDYDLDGDLDLFVSAWTMGSGGNRLFRNDGAGAPGGVPRFVDASAEAGLDMTGVRGFTPRMVDLTGDRYPELLLANDFMTSRLLENNGPDESGVVTFTDRTASAGIVLDCNAMGSAVGDVDNDGDLDWYITNIYHPPPADLCGNTLYVRTNDAGLAFDEVARQTGSREGGWAWGTAMADLDHDRDLDLLVTSGWITYMGVPARVYLNGLAQGAGLGFHDVAPDAGLNFVGQGRGLVTLDADRDGDLDVAMVELNGALRYWRNDLVDAGARALTLRLVTRTNPCLAPMGYGARVIVRAGGVEQVRAVDGGASYLGQSEMIVHVGLGDAVAADEVELRWADGSITLLRNVSAGAHEVTAWNPADLDRSGALDYLDVFRFLVLFGAGDDRADIDGSGALDVNDALALVAMLAAGCG